MDNIEEKINVTATPGVSQLTILHGTAAPAVREPIKLELSGTVVSPQEYWNKRKALHKIESSNVLYNLEKGFIRLVCDELNFFSCKISGNIEKNSELTKLGINGGREWTLKELYDKLKFMRTFFRDTDKYNTLIGNLTKFTAKINTELAKEGDSRGNKNEVYKVTVDTGFVLDFVLSMPIYKGMRNTDFKVDICFEIREKNISVWLESVELRDAEVQQMEEAIKAEVEYFKIEGLVCIEQ